MICPKCNDQMYHQDGWEDVIYLDGEEEQHWWGRWDCLSCGHSISHWEEGYEGEE